MIKSLNNSITEEKLDIFMDELDNREEFVCVGNACFLAANVCAGQACAIACFGISACAVGLHTW